MSELIDNVHQRKELLKHLIKQLHAGQAPEAVKKQLTRLLGSVPYGEVVEVEQELIAEGLPQQEVLKLCDVHTAAMKGQIDTSMQKQVPPGHPVHTFREENRALEWELAAIGKLHDELKALPDGADGLPLLEQLQAHVHNLLDVDKHYQRKEYLLFPFLEQRGISGPPTVMWGKHDETRALLKGALEALDAATTITAAEARSVFELACRPATTAVEEMIYKEENILLPMSLDTLSEADWGKVDAQSSEYGYSLYNPLVRWQPSSPVEAEPVATTTVDGARVQLPTGSLAPAELDAMLNALPFDLTFVDQHDQVRYFTQGSERIFARSPAILGRKVQQCHPPSSMHVVQRILDDFKAGRASRAPFWIELHGRFVHIEYFALRDAAGQYLGTLEVSQDLTGKRALAGEQRLLSYTTDKA